MCNIRAHQSTTATHLHSTLPARVLVEQAEAHASVALHAMEEIQPQALPPPADVAEGAVVDAPAGLVVKQVTNAAVVARHAGAAAAAGARGGLPQAAFHAHHLGDGVAVHPVVAGVIVAQPGGRITDGGGGEITGVGWVGVFEGHGGLLLGGRRRHRGTTWGQDYGGDGGRDLGQGC